jgi:signal transduction histidine kinase
MVAAAATVLALALLAPFLDDTHAFWILFVWMLAGLAFARVLDAPAFGAVPLGGRGTRVASADEEQTSLSRARRERLEAEAMARRSGLLADAGRVLAETTDYQAALTGIAGLVVPTFADWCAIDLLDDKGRLGQVALVHVDRERSAVASARRRKQVAPPRLGSGSDRALSSGLSERYDDVSDSAREQLATDESQQALLRDLDIKSAIVSPLVARGRSLGVLTFMLADSDRRYDPIDVAHADELARLCAVAVDNARLYATAQAEREEARAADRTKDEFLATVSHELRTPLNAVLGWTRLLRGGSLDGEMTERALASIERNARIQAQLIDDVLDVSRVTTGKLRLELRPVDLTQVLEEAIEVVRPAAAAKHINLHLVVDRRAASIVGDADRLRQVFWNLLSNAVKYTPENGQVEISLRRNEAQVEIGVRDTGIGIRAEFLPYVFDRFRQADSSATRTYGGLGLGLAIVRHLVELHGGSVRVESGGTGKGALFVVRLPAEARSVQEEPIPPVLTEDSPPVRHPHPEP